MKKIDSFTVNHLDLLRGVYVSRKDYIGSEVVTTFDIRMKRPNVEPVMHNGEMHTIEHLGATFLRNHKEYADKIIYFGPMGCRTGFYLLIGEDKDSKDIISLLCEMFKFISEFKHDVPGANPKDCGNYIDMNLPMAKHEAKKFLKDILSKIENKNLTYPK